MRACYQDMIIGIRDGNLGNLCVPSVPNVPRSRSQGIKTAWRIKEASVTFICLALAYLA